MWGGVFRVGCFVGVGVFGVWWYCGWLVVGGVDGLYGVGGVVVCCVYIMCVFVVEGVGVCWFFGWLFELYWCNGIIVVVCLDLFVVFF